MKDSDVRIIGQGSIPILTLYGVVNLLLTIIFILFRYLNKYRSIKFQTCCLVPIDMCKFNTEIPMGHITVVVSINII